VSVLAVTLCCSTAWAAPPRVDFLFPAGASRGTTTEIVAHGAFDPWPVHVWCSRPDVQISAGADKGKLSVTIPADAVPGRCWIRLHNAEGASALRPLIIGALPEIVESEPNNEAAKPQRLDATSLTINGQLERAGDVDVFALPLKQGETLVARLDGHQLLGAPLDGVLQILSPAGFVLEHNDDDFGLDPQIVYPVPADGVYLVRALAFPAETNANIGLAGGANYVYRLTLTTGPFVDHAWPDVIPAVGQAEVQLIGWNLPEQLQRLQVSAAPDETAVTLHSSGLANFRRLPATDAPVVPEATSSGTREPQPVPVPSAVTGLIGEMKESDSYRVHLVKGQVVHLRAEARGIGSHLDPVLAIGDTAGKTLQRVDDAGATPRDSELTFSAPEEGDYVVTVSDLHRRGGMRFFYRLRVSTPLPDFSLSAAVDPLTLTSDKPLEIPVTVGRVNGFADEIEFVVEGQPESVAVTPVKSLKEGDSSKGVKLVLTAAAGSPAWSGPIRIRGVSSGEQTPAHPVEALLNIDNERTSIFWLTVVAAPAK
jgi:hypothetical protein